MKTFFKVSYYIIVFGWSLFFFASISADPLWRGIFTSAAIIMCLLGTLAINHVNEGFDKRVIEKTKKLDHAIERYEEVVGILETYIYKQFNTEIDKEPKN